MKRFAELEKARALESRMYLRKLDRRFQAARLMCFMNKTPMELNPETIFLEFEKFESLSDEAKQIINIILYAPQELSDILLKRNGKRVAERAERKIVQKLIQRLSTRWGDFRYAESVMDEIREYLRSF